MSKFETTALSQGVEAFDEQSINTEIDRIFKEGDVNRWTEFDWARYMARFQFEKSALTVNALRAQLDGYVQCPACAEEYSFQNGVKLYEETLEKQLAVKDAQITVLEKDLRIVRDSQEGQRRLNKQAWEREQKLEATIKDKDAEIERLKNPREFPIMRERGAKPHPTTIPWELADLAYSVYSARYRSEQSLKRIAERGGFGPGEMDMFVPDWRDRASKYREMQTTIAEQSALLAECLVSVSNLIAANLGTPFDRELLVKLKSATAKGGV